MTARRDNAGVTPPGEAKSHSAEHAYAEFVRLMNEESLYTDCCVTFEAVCRLLGQDVGSLDRIVASELGMTGQQLMDILRHRWLSACNGAEKLKCFNE